MKIAITGLSNSGKTTVFNALTGLNAETPIYPNVSGEPNIGVVKVPDKRIIKLSEIYKPKKMTFATIEYIDYIGLTKGDTKQNKKVFDLIKDADAIVHVVRVFQNESVSHPLEYINPLRDIETVELELIFSDLDLVEKRLERMEENKKRGKKPDESEQKLLLKLKDFLLKENALRDYNFTTEELISIRHLQFLSIIPKIIVLNIGEEDLNVENIKTIKNDITKQYHTSPVLSFCGKLEMEIAQLPHEEKQLFLDDLKIDEPASFKLIQTCYEMLGLISFITVGEDEVRAWTIKKDTPAVVAAGKIHSDIERGFIRAEVISYDDFITLGNMQTAREKGLLRLEGKTYPVKDGDIINFRFNV